MRTIKLENDKEVQISEESYKELSKAIQKKEYDSLEEMYEDNIEQSWFSDRLCDAIRNTFPTVQQFLEYGNVYDKKVLLQERARRHLWNIAFVLNDGWKPNWGNGSEPKYHVFYNYLSSTWDIESYYKYNICVPAFRTKKLAEKAIGLMRGAKLLNDYRML